MAKVVPDGVSSYKDLQIGGAYYVDKTPYIKTILESASTKIFPTPTYSLKFIVGFLNPLLIISVN